MQRKQQTRHRATRLDDLRIQHSIRINDPWRVCFVGNGSDAENAEIVNDN